MTTRKKNNKKLDPLIESFGKFGERNLLPSPNPKKIFTPITQLRTRPLQTKFGGCFVAIKLSFAS